MYKLIVYYLITISLLLASCVGKPKAMKFTYGKDKTKAVVMDLYTAEAALKDVDDKHKDSLNALYKLQIEQIHEVKIEVIEADIIKLQESPEQYATFHGEVVDSLVMIEKSMKEQETEKIVRKQNNSKK